MSEQAATEVDEVDQAVEPSTPAALPQAQGGATIRRENGPAVRGLSQLPKFTRSLLRVSVPVRVQLATKKEYVQEIVEMAPGSILTFEKRCDELLQLAVGEQIVADGEAVKVGDKFGFRVQQMVLPKEHFEPVRGATGANTQATSDVEKGAGD